MHVLSAHRIASRGQDIYHLGHGAVGISYLEIGAHKTICPYGAWVREQELTLRVLICGGGIAGLTLAYWLYHYGFETVVIEQTDDIRHDGYGLDFYGTGYDVAERMNLIERLQAEQLRIDAITYVNSAGKPLARIDRTLMYKIMRGRYMGLMRQKLEAILYEVIAGDVEVRFGRSLVDVQQDQEAVTVTFNDGTTETFDRLVGADGIHSTTRKLVFGPEEQFGRYLGYYFASYALPDRYGIGLTWKNYPEPGRLAAAYGSDTEGEVVTLFMYEAANEGYITRKQRLPRLRQVFAGMGWIAGQLLDDIPDPNAIFMDTVTQIKMPAWYKGRVVLVGDACGCPTLLSGQGASLAMGGAYMLAKALHETANYQDAFRRYEIQVRPHVEERQKNARDLAKSFVPRSKIEMKMQLILMKLVLREVFVGLLRRQFGAESLLEVQDFR
jgi:2-polyprenyl-6-methoxyphenol hydroxylase-like FAD-dependent oxidoreductase